MKVLPFFGFLCFFISILTEYSIAVNTISSSNFLRDGQTLVSPGEFFELGFFGNGSRYLGLWYKNISNKMVVWVANRDTPLSDLSGVLKIDDRGNLVLLNGSGSVIWHTNISEVAIDPIAQLLESGNLVLGNNNSGNPESSLWQSFDYPSHTLIPGMKLGWTSKDGLNRYLTSWKNKTDPSNGDFTVGIEDPELPQVVVRYKSRKHNRIGPYNGFRFSGGPEFKGENFVSDFVYEKNEVYYLDKPAYYSAIVRFELTLSGHFEHSYWNYPVGNWSISYTLDQDRCDSYNKCGENGVCKKRSVPVCQCLDGFAPKSQKDWSLGNYSEGCVRITPLNCLKGDEFQTFTRLQLPDTLHYWLNKNISLQECKAECLKNCTCMAYANSDISKGIGCILWFHNLVDIQQFDDGGQEVYVRMGTPKQDSNPGSNKLDVEKVIIPLVSAVLVLSLLVCYIVWKKRPTRKGNNIINNEDTASTNRSQEENFELPLLDLLTIATATNNFSFANKIGEGGFGPVYKGVMPMGEEIAIKRLSKVSKQGRQEFMNEVVLIAKLQHRNLVRLLGCCIQQEERMLIYEYLPNKSLDFFIFDETRRKNLDWNKRFNIIVGIARGLLYLHRDSRLRIIHRDLKAGNILLDNRMNPKISDFGMARTFGGDQTEDNTRRVVGTYGYMSPEYATDGLFSMKSDVFSFGVLVLEIVSGNKNRGFHHVDHALNLLGHAWKLLSDEKALELVDESIKESCTISEVLKCIQVGLLCVQTFQEDRPEMSSVLSMLDSDGATLPWPKQPGFYTERSHFEKDSSSSQTGSTINSVTVTVIEGR